uniref:Glutamine cyclotransferase n=1 Tax=Euplotes harpa TaxID=151035 RepID=A0A7S3JLQ5_9SPIT|mmetsp:Transcript_4589/g.5508  ORF Transcript_4589/g.5508 Transcript_4589/m.5508 type:complete len:263 (+) Transcript_4589:33-821(+)
MKVLIMVLLVTSLFVATNSFEVIGVYDLPSKCFVEGYIYRDGMIVESCGPNGKSRVQTYTLDSNSKSASLPHVRYVNDYEVFAEGLAYLDGLYYQLTYTTGEVYVYDDHFHLLETLELPEEMENSGWGLTTDGEFLYANNGENILFKIQPSTFEVVDQIPVIYSDGSKADNINECEVAKGVMFCNVFMSNNILKINYQTGEVLEIYNMTPLATLATTVSKNNRRFHNFNPKSNVLNGIAYNENKGSFYVTGKDWPAVFEVLF